MTDPLALTLRCVCVRERTCGRARLFGGSGSQRVRRGRLCSSVPVRVRHRLSAPPFRPTMGHGGMMLCACLQLVASFWGPGPRRFQAARDHGG